MKHTSAGRRRPDTAAPAGVGRSAVGPAPAARDFMCPVAAISRPQTTKPGRCDGGKEARPVRHARHQRERARRQPHGEAERDEDQPDDAVVHLHGRTARGGGDEVRPAASARDAAATDGAGRAPPTMMWLALLGEADGLDRLAERGVQLGHERHEVLAAHLHHVGTAAVLELGPFGRVHDPCDGVGIGADDIVRQPGRAGDGDPGRQRPAGLQELGGGRHVRERLHAVGVHVRKRLQLTEFDECLAFRQGRARDIDAAGHQLLHRRRRALGRDPADGLGVDPLGVQHTGQSKVPDAALRGAGRRHLAGFSLAAASSSSSEVYGESAFTSTDAGTMSISAMGVMLSRVRSVSPTWCMVLISTVTAPTV